jgi:hypothetical protein
LREKSPIGLFAALSKLMVLLKTIKAARVRDARIHDLGDELWIREERENDVFPFPWSGKSRMDFSRPY